MDKRSKKKKHIERSKWAETYKDGFDHGYVMGYDLGYKKAIEESGKGDIINDDQVEEME